MFQKLPVYILDINSLLYKFKRQDHRICRERSMLLKQFHIRSAILTQTGSRNIFHYASLSQITYKDLPHICGKFQAYNTNSSLFVFSDNRQKMMKKLLQNA